MQWSYPELRRRLLEADLWPQGRMARIACYLAALAAVLYALEKLLGVFKLTWGEHLGGWVGFLVFVASLLFFILAFRWIRRRILWRLRNRLIVTYVFIGVIPAVLLIAMAIITLYGLGGQFAIFVVSSEIHAQLRGLEAANSAVTNELAAHLERGEKPTAESLAGMRKRDPLVGAPQSLRVARRETARPWNRISGSAPDDTGLRERKVPRHRPRSRPVVSPRRIDHAGRLRQVDGCDQ